MPYLAKKDGILFVALKEGDEKYTRDDGRFFNLFTKDRFLDLTKGKFKLIKFKRENARSYNTGNENWLDFYLQKNHNVN